MPSSHILGIRVGYKWVVKTTLTMIASQSSGVTSLINGFTMLMETVASDQLTSSEVS